MYGQQARVISADLGNDGAYHFYSQEYGLIVVVNTRHNSDIQEEGKFHEAREVHWMSRGFTQHEAHVIASAEQVQKFSIVDSFTNYHAWQLRLMNNEELKRIGTEGEEARRWHHSILKRVNSAFECQYKNFKNRGL